MGFVKEFRDIYDEFPEWEYLNKIGVRDMFDDPLDKYILSLVVDRENNYFLIPQGHTNISREEKAINYFALCIDDKVINMEIEENRSGSAREETFECHWNVEKIKLPADWSFNKISVQELKQIIVEALTVKTYDRTFTPERTRALTVKITAPLDNAEEDEIYNEQRL